MRRVAIVGSGGQDGHLLTELLEVQGCDVRGVRRGDVDFTELENVQKWISEGFDEIYYLAAHHHSSQERVDQAQAELNRLSFDTHVSGAVNILESLRRSASPGRFLYAGSSLMFGDCLTDFPDEATPLSPQCVYGISKTAGFQMCRFYREKFGVFASGVILFNHESHLRPSKFVVPKVIDAALAAQKGTLQSLQLGNLQAEVDWGYASDFVDAMTKVIRLSIPEDYIVATGQTHTVAELLDEAFSRVGKDWKDFVKESSEILGRQRRPIRGNFHKLREATGWYPKTGFREMIGLIMEARRGG